MAEAILAVYVYYGLLTRLAKLRKLVEAKAEARAKAAAAMPAAATAAGAAGAKAAAAVAAARSRAAGASVLRRLLSADSAQWVSAEQVSSRYRHR